MNKEKKIEVLRAITSVIAGAVCAILLVYLTQTSASAETSWTENQVKAHEIAETARSMGLPEDNPIIIEAKRLWQYEEYIKPSETDVRILATTIYNEAWFECSERHRELVAAVVYNRVNDPAFPNTVEEVISQSGYINGRLVCQYLPAYTIENGEYHLKAMKNPEAWEECCRIAEKALRGEINCPNDVIFQAQFTQGHGVYETCSTSYSTTYFCYK